MNKGKKIRLATEHQRFLLINSWSVGSVAETAYPSGSPDFSGVRVAQSSVFCVVFVDHYLHSCSFSFVPLTIVLSVLLQLTDSDYAF